MYILKVSPNRIGDYHQTEVIDLKVLTKKGYINILNKSKYEDFVNEISSNTSINYSYDEIEQLKEHAFVLASMVDETITKEEVDTDYFFNEIKEYKIENILKVLNIFSSLIEENVDYDNKHGYAIFSGCKIKEVDYSIKKLKKDFVLFKVKMTKKEFLIIKNNYEKENKIILALVILSSFLERNNIPFYKTFYIPKSDGTKRKISEPEENLKLLSSELNNWLKNIFNKKISKNESNQYAYIEKRSIKMNAQLHRDSEKIIHFDISKFFDNCDWDHVKKFLPYENGEFDRYLSKCFIDPETNGLYMGNPISGTISNNIVYKAMTYIKNICEKNDIKVSLYADDFVFSGNKNNPKLSIKFLSNLVNGVFSVYKLPFTLKKDKTKVLKGNSRKVTGIRINTNNDLIPDRKKYAMMKSILEHLEHGKPVSFNKMEIQGMLTYFLEIDTSNKFKKLLLKYQEVLDKNKIRISEKYYEEAISCQLM